MERDASISIEAHVILILQVSNFNCVRMMPRSLSPFDRLSALAQSAIIPNAEKQTLQYRTTLKASQTVKPLSIFWIYTCFDPRNFATIWCGERLSPVHNS